MHPYVYMADILDKRCTSSSMLVRCNSVGMADILDERCSMFQYFFHCFCLYYIIHIKLPFIKHQQWNQSWQAAPAFCILLSRDFSESRHAVHLDWFKFIFSVLLNNFLNNLAKYHLFVNNLDDVKCITLFLHDLLSICTRILESKVIVLGEVPAC